MRNKNYDYKLNTLFNVIWKHLKLSIINYFLCIVSLFLINFEIDLSNLNNGMLIIILFYVELGLIVINIYQINTKDKSVSFKGDIYKKVELALRVVNILLINLNLNRIDINISVKSKFIILACSVILSIVIILYDNNRSANSKKLVAIDNNSVLDTTLKKNVDHISLVGIIIYMYSVTILNREISFNIIPLKIFMFYFSMNLIYMRLKEHRKNLSTKSLYLIFGTLITAFILNLVLAISLRFYINKISIEDYKGLKDVMIIVSLLFAIPLFREYTKQN